MKILLKKFGTTLSSRQFGREAYSAFLPTLKQVPKKETITVDFEGVNTFTPSWGDEFLTALMKSYKNRIKLVNTSNLSVSASLKLLEEVNDYKFKIE